MTESPFYTVNNFLSAEECQHFLDIIETYATDDVKPGYRSLGLIRQENLDNNQYPSHLDPNKLLISIIDKVRDYYESSYEMQGTFVFDRIFANHMLEGSIHPSHRDQEPGLTGEFDGKKRSHVCSILLNDDYEGGELTFNEYAVKVKPEPGSLTLFRGYYVEHGVNRIRKGSRINLLVFFYDILP